MPRTGEQAIDYIRERMAEPIAGGAGWCKREVRKAYGIVPSTSADATEAWREASHRHPNPNPMEAPRGVPMFWSGGSAGHGHVAISLGAGRILSTDLPRAGMWGEVSATEPHIRWGLTYRGWTEDLDGEDVWTGLHPAVKAPPKSEVQDLTRGTYVDAALEALGHARGHGRRARRIRRAIAALLGIRPWRKGTR